MARTIATAIANFLSDIDQLSMTAHRTPSSERAAQALQKRRPRADRRRGDQRRAGHHLAARNGLSSADLLAGVNRCDDRIRTMAFHFERGVVAAFLQDAQISTPYRPEACERAAADGERLRDRRTLLADDAHLVIRK